MNLETIKAIAQIIGPIVAAGTFILAYRFGVRQLRLNTRNTFQTMLLDVDKALINNPKLWEVYDKYASSATSSNNESLLEAELRGFIYFKLNMFDLVFAYYDESRRSSFFGGGRLSRMERESRQLWENYFYEFLSGSKKARNMIAGHIDQRTRNLYSRTFLGIADRLINKIKLSNSPQQESLPIP